MVGEDVVEPGKAWSGRFTEPTDALVERFTVSLPFDRALFRQDIAGSIAHVRMLAGAGLLTTEQAETVEDELSNISRQIEDGDFPFAPGDEDIHMAIERVLTERVGEAGARLHTARSRNDQVATDLRLWVHSAGAEIATAIRVLQEVVVGRADEELTARTVLPGYTHLQRAQPVPLAHHLLAYFWMLERDHGRIADCLKRTSLSPLGSAALAGTSLPIDRHATASDLGFTGVTQNSLDAVSDRDFAVELLSALSLVMVHLSRMAEEVVLWTTSEFGFASLPDSFATGSSMMPQKKNPDVAELVRGKVGRVVGSLTAMLVTLKGLPLSYNRDLQEDKEGLFDAVETTQLALQVWAGLLGGIEFRRDTMAAAAGDDMLYATDLMEHLVREGVPLRTAHHAVGRAVKTAVDSGTPLSKLSAAAYAECHEAFAGLGLSGSKDAYARVLAVFSASDTLGAKTVAGSAGFPAVAAQLAEARQVLEASAEHPQRITTR